MERWIPAYGEYAYRYLVSDWGRVWDSLKNKFIKQTPKDDYRAVGLVTDNGIVKKSIRVHRLIMQSFHPNEEALKNPRKHQVNHKDTNKSNNRLTNLEWSTPQKNILHSIENGTFGSLSRKGKPRNRPVFQYLNGVLIGQFDTITEAGKVSSTHWYGISRNANGKQKSANGYVWKFAEA